MSNPIVVDLGSASIRAGFTSNGFPDLIIQNVVGRPINNKQIDAKDFMIGNEATQLYQYLNLEKPIENGILNSCDSEKLVFDYIFKKLEIDLSGQQILIAEPQTGNKCRCNGNRKKIIELLFEEYNIGSINLCQQSILSL